MVLDFIAEEDSKIPFSKDRVILPPWKSIAWGIKNGWNSRNSLSGSAKPACRSAFLLA